MVVQVSLDLRINHLVCTKLYSLCPSRFFTVFSFGHPTHFFALQNFPKIANGPYHFPSFSFFHTIFTLLSSFYILKINGSHHFTHFSFFFPLFYTYFLTSVSNLNINNWARRREYYSFKSESQGIITRALLGKMTILAYNVEIPL